ncbi:hypothetical protein [Limnohabitans sp. DM1]|nr:hypothetical protein [Limnohabitans sp. DM1]
MREVILRTATCRLAVVFFILIFCTWVLAGSRPAKVWSDGSASIYLTMT